MKIKKLPLSMINDEINEPYDLFICSSSYESRCLSIATNINTEKIHRALILSNSDLSEFVEPNKIQLMEIFTSKGRPVDVCTTDPICTADKLHKNLFREISNGKIGSLLLDVTTFTHESLLILLRLMQQAFPQVKVTGVYANASEYSIGDEIHFKWLSRGIGDVRSVLGFPGNISPSRKTHLILIVGYEHERAAGIIEKIEPHSIALGYGRSASATTEKDRHANEHYMHLVKEMTTSYCPVNTFEIPCDNPWGTLDELRKQISKATDMNIILAPMNNKLSTIGSAWSAFENENVQICYAQALRYNYTNYSKPGSNCYLFDIKS